MKKVIMLLSIIMVFLVSGCTQDEGNKEYYVLPDLNGLEKEEIIEKLDKVNQSYTFEVFEEEIELYSNEFIMYKGHNTGDIVDKSTEVVIVVYPVFSGERTIIKLPDLSGLNKSEIESYFDDYNLRVSFSETTESTEDNQGLFVGYGGFYDIGDHFPLTSALSVIVYKEFVDSSVYFYPIDMVYDGPYLDDSYELIDPINPRGGSFDVTLLGCRDGDTASFIYPTEVYDAIISDSKTVRFLNMDTEETWNGGEEEWGKPGSVYTCSLLQQATDIKLQTDPGDSLTGTYGRLLSWVWIKLPGEDEYFLLNYMVVKQGLAQVKYEYGAGLDLFYGEKSYNQWMHIAEDYAKENELGQWGDLLDYYWDYQNNKPMYDRWH